MENFLTVTVRSTHYYLIDIPGGKFMVDTGWPGTLSELQALLRRMGVYLEQVRYFMITHNHLDHAGLAQALKTTARARMVIHEAQVPCLEGQKGYEQPRLDPGDVLLVPDNRAALAKLGLAGQVIPTPGHSPDSVSLVLDSGLAFTGDLHPPDFEVGEARAQTLASWRALRQAGARSIYPAHGSPFGIERVSAALDEG